MKRIALYTFFEKNGIVRDFVLYYLNRLHNVCETIVVIVNGILSPEGRARLNECGVKILVRENKGFDFSAWKAGIEYLGWNEIRSCDELVLCNCSVYGPTFSFDEIFTKMNEVKCDFWGMYRHPEISNINIPSHIQSYFVVFKSKLINDIVFFHYFNKLNIDNKWEDSNYREIHFTEYFEKCGFVAKSYIGNSLYKFVQNPSIFAPVELLKLKFPFVKRKVFYEEYENFLYCSFGEQAKSTIEFLDANNLYNSDLIIDDMLHSVQMSTLMNSLHLNYILSTRETCALNKNNKSVAIIVYSYYEDLIDFNCKYINNVPEEIEVYIVVVSQEMLDKWKLIKNRNHHICDIRIQENRGRNEAAYWITCRDVINNHDYICVVHDKKSLAAGLEILGNRWNRHCWDNLLASKSYIKKVLRLFEQHPRIGLLIPPLPFFGPWRSCIPLHEWGGNKEIAWQIYKTLKLSIPFDETPVAPFGSMFWFRSKAIQPLFRHNWTISDFPKEPLGVIDGTILHALERMYPMIAQDAGFLTGTIMTDFYAEVYYDDLMFEFKKQLSGNLSLYDENQKLKQSRSFRLGRAATWLPRKIRDFLSRKCKF